MKTLPLSLIGLLEISAQQIFHHPRHSAPILLGHCRNPVVKLGADFRGDRNFFVRFGRCILSHARNGKHRSRHCTPFILYIALTSYTSIAMMSTVNSCRARNPMRVLGGLI